MTARSGFVGRAILEKRNALRAVLSVLSALCRRGNRFVRYPLSRGLFCGRFPRPALLPALLSAAGMFSLAVAVGGGLMSCGLPSLTFIDGPRSDSVEVDRSLSLTVFEHNAQANDIDAFKGYELYYKLFPYDAGNDSAYESDVAYITEDPPVTGTSRLTSRGYTRVSAEDAGARPLIAVAFENRDESFEISVSFNQSNPGGEFDGSATATWNGNTVRLNRSATDNAGNSKPYFPINTTVYDVGGDGGADDELDADISDLDNPAELVDQENLAVGLFALGYGQDGTTFEIIYSEPTELGWFKLQ